MPTLLDLPSELLVHVLVNAALDDVRTLAAVGHTCKQLHAAVYGEDQHVWKTVHMALYDDPRRARAFPAPRSGVDWRTRVIERDNAVRSLDGPHTVEEIYKIELTALRLYDDLPDHVDNSGGVSQASLLTTSRNAVLLVKLATVCRDVYYRGPDPFLSERPRISALCRLHSLVVDWDGEYDGLDMYTSFHTRALCSPSKGRVVKSENEWAPLSHDGTVWWNAMDMAVCTMVLNTRFCQTYEDLEALATDVPMNLDTVCGTGLLSAAQADISFDWAGVHGQWYGAGAEGLGQYQGTGPVGPFDLYPVQTWDEMEATYGEYSTASTRGLKPKLGGAELKALLDTKLPTSSARAPVWFHGHTTPGHAQDFIDPYPQAFVGGVVRLTPEAEDEPPQPRWTMVVLPTASDPAGSDKCMAFQGVQVGGVRAKRGVFGFWRDIDEEAASKGECGAAWWWTIGSV